MKIRHVLFVAVLVLAVAPAYAVATDTIVASFFPDRLVQLTRDERTATVRYQAYDVTNFGESGQSYIVAAYSNGFHAVVRVLQTVPAGWNIVAEQNLDHLVGAYPSVELVDLTGDGTPEAIVRITENRGSEPDWIFQWRNPTIVMLNPTTDAGLTDTALTNIDLLDIDGDGIPEIIDNKVDGTNDDPRSADTIYKWSTDHFTPAAPLAYHGVFNRGTGAPAAETASFSMGSTSRSASIVIINGGYRGAGHRASSAEITLNGVTVVPASEFNQQRAIITAPVALQQDNQLTVRIASDPGSQIVVLIKP